MELSVRPSDASPTPREPGGAAGRDDPPADPPAPRSDPSGLTVTATEWPKLLVIRFAGPLDAYSVDEAADLLDHPALQRSDVVIDMREVTLIDSAGLGMVVGLANRAAAFGHRTGIVRRDAILDRIFEITGRTSMFAFGDDIPGAYAAVRAAAPARRAADPPAHAPQMEAHDD